jgi:hypothetical protein
MSSELVLILPRRSSELVLLSILAVQLPEATANSSRLAASTSLCSCVEGNIPEREELRGWRNLSHDYHEWGAGRGKWQKESEIGGLPLGILDKREIKKESVYY